jgi:NAD(P)-dependent dehydrogenase (short-subunit alcohol dehydrogenase family)
MHETDIATATVFITGGAQGIGLGIARAFAGAGAKLALVDIDTERLENTRKELAERTDVATFPLDVRDRTAFGQVADAVEEQLGPVTVVVNNAGVGTTEPFRELDFDKWDYVLGVNLNGAVNGVQTFLPRLLERGGPGHIVNVASGAGLISSQRVTYVTSKFAVVGMSESLAQVPDLSERGIGVTVVCPGFVNTDVIANSAGGEAKEEFVHLFREFGLSIDVVGEQVLQGVREDRLYVLTDRITEQRLTARTQHLLGSLPEETERDRRLAAVLAEEVAKLERTQRG